MLTCFVVTVSVYCTFYFFVYFHIFFFPSISLFLFRGSYFGVVESKTVTKRGILSLAYFLVSETETANQMSRIPL